MMSLIILILLLVTVLLTDRIWAPEGYTFRLCQAPRHN